MGIFNEMKDYYSDYGHNFVKIFKNSELPDFVKEAEMISEETLASMPDEAFANKVARKLPISSAADTYISIAYHLSCNDKDENVDQSLNKAASFWGINEEVEKLKASISEMSKSASAETEEVKSWSISHATVANGGVMIKAAGTDTDGLQKAYTGFMNKSAFFPFSDRVTVAKQFATEFDKMGMEIPFELGAMSERNFPNVNEVAQQLKSRAIRIADHSKKAAELIKIADDLLSAEGRDIEGYSKLAEMIDDIDHKNYLGRFYGNPLKNAHESVFNTPREEAIKACGTLKLASGEYSIADLEEIHDDIFKLALTEEDYKMVCKIADVASAAPNPILKTFVMPKGIDVATKNPKTSIEAQIDTTGNGVINENSKIIEHPVNNRLYASSPVWNPTIKFARERLLHISEESKKNLAEYL